MGKAKSRAVHIDLTDIHDAIGASFRGPIIEGMSYGVPGNREIDSERVAATFNRGRSVTAKVFGRDGELVGTFQLPVSDDDVVVMRATVWTMAAARAAEKEKRERQRP